MPALAAQRLSRRHLLRSTTTTGLAALVGTGIGAEVLGQPDDQPAVPAQALEFELVGTPADYGPTQSHQNLADLQLWHDRIYVGHGDWYNNTGPVRAMYFDLASGSIVHDDSFSFDDEAVESFVVLDDVLYAIGTDALAVEGWEFGNLYRKYWGGAWEKLHTVPWVAHLFGVGQLGGILVASGTEVDPATMTDSGRAASQGAIWQSWDGAYSWAVAARFGEPGFHSGPEGFESYVIEFDDRLIVTTPKDGCYVFDGANWSALDCVPETPNGVAKAVRFGPDVVMVPYIPSRDYSSRPAMRKLMFFDGQEHWSVDLDAKIRDIIVDDDVLYVLTETLVPTSGSILATTDASCRYAEEFVKIGEIGGDFRAPRSLERAENRFFVGCADGKLIRSGLYVP
jgi:hypothetical protein